MKRKLLFKDYTLASLVFHTVFFAALYFLPRLLNSNSPKEAQVEVTIVTSDEVPVEAVQIAPQVIAKPKGQIVETTNANEKENPKAELLSEKNNSVDKQTIAKLGEKFKNVKKSTPKEQNLADSKKPDKSKPTKPSLFNEPFDPYAALAKKQLDQELKNFSKDQDQFQQDGSSTATDRVDGVQSDLITTLNTREYKYYGFYHRIKLQLNQWWQPKVREKITKMVRSGRSLASETNRVTRLMIVLNNSGTLVKVQVVSASGVRDLDDAAIEAFRSAAPFPNPPKGLIESDGTVKIPWDFVIES